MYNSFTYPLSTVCWMLICHLDVTWVSQSLYSGPLSNPDFFLSLIAGRIRQVVLYMKIAMKYYFILLQCYFAI